LPESFRVPEAFASVDEVLRGLAALEDHFTACGSRGGAFATAYLITTRAVQAARRIAAVTPVLPALGAHRATPRLGRVVLESNA
jgi:hypothetical protein